MRSWEKENATMERVLESKGRNAPNMNAENGNDKAFAQVRGHAPSLGIRLAECKFAR
jgi:hypothetical protein